MRSAIFVFGLPLGGPQVLSQTGSDRLRFVDEHDGNVIPNGVAQMAGMTDENRFLLSVLELSFALRADQDL